MFEDYTRQKLKNIYFLMSPCSGSLGASLVPADWQVRVFKSSGLVYRQSDRMFVRTIPLYGCIERSSRYTPFYSQ